MGPLEPVFPGEEPEEEIDRVEKMEQEPIYTLSLKQDSQRSLFWKKIALLLVSVV